MKNTSRQGTQGKEPLKKEYEEMGNDENDTRYVQFISFPAKVVPGVGFGW